MASDPNEYRKILSMALYDFYQKHDATAAYDGIDRALKLNPRFANALVAKGIFLSDQGKYKEAIEAFTAALAIEPKNSFAFSERSGANYFLKDYTAAISDLQAAIAIEPDDTTLLMNMGELLSKTNQRADALTWWNKSIDLLDQKIKAAGPDTCVADLHQSRGVVLQMAARYNEALEALNRAIELDPSDPEAYHRRGIVYLNILIPEMAVNDFTKALELNPNSASDYQLRSQTYRRMGLDRLAEEDEKRLADLTSNPKK